MNTTLSLRRLYATTAFALIATAAGANLAPAIAQDAILAPDLLVTSGVTPLPTKQVSSSYTIVTAEQIAARQYRTVSEALNGVPGIHLVQQGGLGKVSSVFSRGANSNQTLVLMNGQNIGDPSTPSGAFNFADLTLENVDRIEVVRGPQSALYGSQAIGGVINIITKTGSSTPTTTARIEGGTLGTINTSIVSGGSLGKMNYFATISRHASDSSDITPKRYRGIAAREKDGYENLTGSLKLGAELSENISVSAFGQIVDTYTDLDTELPQNLSSRTKNKSFYVNGEIRGNFLGNLWKPVLGFAYTKSKRNDIDVADVYSVTTGLVENEGDRFSVNFDNSLALTDWNTLSFGVQYLREEFKQTGFTDFGFGFIQSPFSEAEEDAVGFYLSNHMTLGEYFFATASVRHDAPDSFHNKTTWSIAPGVYLPESDTRITASYGTGFKVPSLFERYGFTLNSFGSGFYGNPNLLPEESRGWEASVDQGFLDGTVNVGATWFSNRIDNAITTIFLPSFDSTTINTASFKSRGVESYIHFAPCAEIDLRADYTFTVIDSDLVTASQTRRPRHKVNLAAIYKPTAATTLSAETQIVMPYRDISRQTGAIIKPGSYTVVNVAASHRLNEWLEITAKVNNLLNRDYEPADGFRASGIEALAGVALTF